MDATPYHPLLRRKLQQTLAPSGEPEEEPNEDLSIIAVICCALFFIVFSVLLVHDFRTRKRSLAEARRSEEIAEESDRRLLQIGEKERLAKREERREWYANYFKPCTMVRIHSKTFENLFAGLNSRTSSILTVTGFGFLLVGSKTE
jgi:hypothetical protein